MKPNICPSQLVSQLVRQSGTTPIELLVRAKKKLYQMYYIVNYFKGVSCITYKSSPLASVEFQYTLVSYLVVL